MVCLKWAKTAAWYPDKIKRVSLGGGNSSVKDFIRKKRGYLGMKCVTWIFRRPFTTKKPMKYTYGKPNDPGASLFLLHWQSYLQGVMDPLIGIKRTII